MVADSNAIVYRLERIQEQFSSLTQMVTGPETRSATAVELECQLFRALLELGRQLLLVFFETRASIRPETPVAADGSLLAESRLRPKTYLSVFGKLRFERDRFFAVGKAAVSPLDAELSLPEHCYSPLLRDWAGHELVESPYGISAQVLERIQGLKLSKNQDFGQSGVVAEHAGGVSQSPELAGEAELGQPQWYANQDRTTPIPIWIVHRAAGSWRCRDGLDRRAEQQPHGTERGGVEPESGVSAEMAERVADDRSVPVGVEPTDGVVGARGAGA